MELADAEAAVGTYVDQMKSTFDAVATAHLNAIDTHMNIVAGRLGTEPVKIVLTRDQSLRTHPKPHPRTLRYRPCRAADGRLTSLEYLQAKECK